MTEKEAKKKWCPFARVGDDDGVTYNRWRPLWGDKPFKTTACIGSRCMAWRWTVSSRDTPTSEGHCGLAGRP